MTPTEKRLDLYRLSAEYDAAMECRKWALEIPGIKFPAHWEVKITPPFAGAVVRFRVSRGDGRCVSVYLDCYDILGFQEEPYWEVFPYEDDTFRCPMNDVDALLAAIQKSLDEG